jgi:hypothetical protein
MVCSDSVRRALLFALVALSAAGYFFGQQSNPPGFYVDESSIAYNALCIATTGRDEHGVRFPLFFRAFGEYKNPTHIYVLAAVFRLAEPSNLLARRVSAAAGFSAALLLGWLALRVGRRPWIGVAVFLATLAMPALYEISRLAFEVALYPAVLALFLLASHAAATRTDGALRASAARGSDPPPPRCERSVPLRREAVGAWGQPGCPLRGEPRSGGARGEGRPSSAAPRGTRRRDRWSVFVLCGAALSLVPASVTTDTLHTLRMAPFLVFLLVLSIPAFQALAARPTVLWAVLLGGLAQDLGNGYVHAYWYGALRGISRDAYAWLPPGQAPPGSLILSDREVPGLTVVSRHGTYFGYLTAPRRAP